MRTISAGLTLGLVGLVLGPLAAGCTSILGDFSPATRGDASAKESGGTDARADRSAPDAGHPPDTGAPIDAMVTKDVLAEDAPVDSGCAHFCGSPGVCTDTMTSRKNCGRCGHDCLTGTCSGGTCLSVTMVATSSGFATSINDADTDGTVVVWGDDGNNSLDQVSTPGGLPTLLVAAGGAVGLRGVAIGAGGALAWTSSSPGAWNTATLGVKSSGVSREMFGASAYTVGLMWDPAGKKIYMMEVAGVGGPYSLYECAPLVSCSSRVTTSGPSPTLSDDVGVGAAGVVFADVNASTVTDFDPGKLTKAVIMPQPDVYHVGADAQNVYWTTSVGATNAIFSAKSGSTTVKTVLANSPAGAINRLASDGTNVYFIDGAGALEYVPVGGASSATVYDSGVYSGVKYNGGALVYWDNTSILLRAAP